MILAICINPAWSGSLLMVGRPYFLAWNDVAEPSSTLGIRHVSVYELKDKDFSEDKLHTTMRDESGYYLQDNYRPLLKRVGMFQISRFELILSDIQLKAALAFSAGRVEFEQSKVPGGEDASTSTSGPSKTAH